MQKFSLEAKISLRKRKYHLRTSNNVFENKVLSSLFEGGEVIWSREISYNHGMEEEDVFELVKSIHEKEKAELESFMRICEKLANSDNGEAHNKLGLAFLKRKMYKEAIDEFMLAIDRDAKFPEAYSNLGMACVELGMHKEATEVFVKAIDLAPEYADLHNSLGKIYLRQKQCKNAIESFERAIELNPYYGEAHYNLALAYMVNALEKEEYEYATSLYERTMKELDTAVKINPSYESPQFQKAKELLAGGNIEEALVEFEPFGHSALTEQTFDLPLHFYLRFLYDEENLDEQSILDYVKTLERMLEKKPDFADLRNHLGVAYTILCRYINRKAVRQFQAALDTNPEYKNAARNLKLAENDSKGFHVLLKAILRGRER
ncbi:hypothetical protein AMJ40_06905 [candidate division TA06 bacterium DG_26]|uniref:UDP-N-acetylglucosamine--peptide N-acetylglucosaminyltransferase SPINDLY n=1 Tax=candidate division TA06 bacterium DG_26 TaxID=1703771 RepID=A0A0S7WF73_UNCT6|nr:MAG: hypothetical protein AMJ40_06905 [candidate division TA06 bacterium DG_26]